ncbi:hypothetical protein FE783_05245 [Paenibacillus mesophilus]|uniref:hypothetical protein n=1 Tax=Paenibacillus mesophilus TaxID=2582849 RepID=UPI00110F1FB0|nr:hypothetical protein [Paenibacillus mesophilus]TMV51190.1 hypothetical protein FE783_05245 [Paenibacillus mesophilus]
MIREWSIRILTVLTLAAVLLFGLLGYYERNPEVFAASTVQPSLPQPTESGNLFDPATIRPGDSAAGLSVQSVKSGTHGTNSVSVQFSGSKEISGRFEVLDLETEAYNPGDVIFTVDDRSAASLPKAKTFHEVPNRFVLHFDTNSDKSKFGEAGSTGTGSIVITDYKAVYADILEGVSDSAMLAGVKTLHLVPPLSPEQNNPDFAKEMKPFPTFKPDPRKAAGDPWSVYAWIENVNKSFYGLAYNGKKISASQRDQVKHWLRGAFTEDRTDELLRTHVPEVEGGYLIGGGSSGLIPPVVIKEVRDPLLTAGRNGDYVFTVTWIVSGTQDAKLTCYLQYGASGWRIDRYGYEMI